MFVDVLFVRDELILKLLFEINSFHARLQPIYGVYDEMETVQVVQHRHVKAGGDRAFSFVATDVEVPMVGAAVSKPMD